MYFRLLQPPGALKGLLASFRFKLHGTTKSIPVLKTFAKLILTLAEPVYRVAEKEWKDFVEAFTDVLVENDPQIPHLPPKDLIHRIYRDVRDLSPLETIQLVMLQLYYRSGSATTRPRIRKAFQQASHEVVGKEYSRVVSHFTDIKPFCIIDRKRLSRPYVRVSLTARQFVLRYVYHYRASEYAPT